MHAYVEYKYQYTLCTNDYTYVSLASYVVTLLLYRDINNGVYKSGFAKSQSAYDKAVNALFKALDKVKLMMSDYVMIASACLTDTEASMCISEVLSIYEHI